MTSPTNPHPSPTAIPLSDHLDDHPDDELVCALRLVEDWLLHASDETLTELAEFIYGPAHHGLTQLRPIIDLLGVAAARHAPTPGHHSANTRQWEPHR
jgi:hypothetical protein